MQLSGSAFAFDTRVRISTEHLIRTRLPMCHRFLRVTSGCGVADGRPIRGGLMPSWAIVVVTSVRVRRFTIARGRHVVIAGGR